MPTDDERREVARRLREVEGYAIPDRRFADHPITGEVIAAAVMYDLPDVKGLLGRLADLIEPSESGQNRDRNQDSVQKESPIVQIEHECDREALLSVADALDDLAVRESELTPLGYSTLARRIREACGEVGE